jgi:hypothetical protein
MAGQDTGTFYTLAPSVYDGFGTETIAEHRRLMYNGREARLTVWRHVDIKPEGAGWQYPRYRSGMYPVLSQREWENWHNDGLLYYEGDPAAVDGPVDAPVS